MCNIQVKQAQKEIAKGTTKPKTHWKEKHEDFVNSVRAARQVITALYHSLSSRRKQRRRVAHENMTSVTKDNRVMTADVIILCLGLAFMQNLNPQMPCKNTDSCL